MSNRSKKEAKSTRRQRATFAKRKGGTSKRKTDKEKGRKRRFTLADGKEKRKKGKRERRKDGRRKEERKK